MKEDIRGFVIGTASILMTVDVICGTILICQKM